MDQDQVLNTKNLKTLDQNQDRNLIIQDQNPLLDHDNNLELKYKSRGLSS